MTAQNPVDVSLKFVEAINGQDLDALAALMAEDHAFVDLEGDLTRGREAMRRGWTGYFSDYPRYQVYVDQAVALDRVAVLVGRTSGSHIPPEIEAHETVIWTAIVEDGLVAEWRVLYADTGKVRRFLGLAGE